MTELKDLASTYRKPRRLPEINGRQKNEFRKRLFQIWALESYLNQKKEEFPYFFNKHVVTQSLGFGNKQLFS